MLYLHYTTAKQESYEGKWVADERCGRGVWKSLLTGEFYEGNWEKHRPNGQGKRVYGDKNIYTGEFQAGLRHGVGTMIYHTTPTHVSSPKGSKHSGANSVKEGFNSSSTYTGQWYQNMRHGEGKWALAAIPNDGQDAASIDSNSGTISFKSLPENSASINNHYITRSDTDVAYEGEWYHDKRNGTGFATYQSGAQFLGEFEDDIPKQQ